MSTPSISDRLSSLARGSEGALYGILLLLTAAIPTLYWFGTYDPVWIKSTLLQMGALALVALLAARALSKPWLFSGDGSLLAVALLPLLVGAVSLLASPVASLEASALAQPLALFMVAAAISFVCARPERFWALIYLWVGVAALLGGYALLQVLGLDLQVHIRTGHYKGNATTSHPNVLAGYLAASLPVTLGVLVASSRKVAPLLALALVLQAAGVLASLSRGAWMGCMVALVVFLLGRTGQATRSRRRIRRALVGAAVLLALALPLAVVLLPPSEAHRLLSPSSRSFQERRYAWEGAWSIIKEYPLLGGGPGSFQTLLPLHRPLGLALLTRDNRSYLRHAVSEPLEVAAETGVVGLLAFLALAILLLVRLNRAALRERDPSRRVLLVGLAAGAASLLTHNLVCVNLRFLPPALAFWTILGLAAARPQEAQPERSQAGGLSWPWLRLLIMAMVVVLAGLAARGPLRHLQARILLKAGVVSLERGEVDRAVEQMTGALALAPRDLDVLYQLAYALTRRNRPGAAHQVYLRAAEKDPHFANLPYNIARAAMADGRWAQAAYWAQRAQELNPFFVESYKLLGQLERSLGRPEEAIRNLEIYLAHRPHDALAREMLEGLWSRVPGEGRPVSSLP